MHHKRNRKPAMSTPFYDLASLVVVPSGYKSGKIYAQKPLTTDGQLTFTRASTATRVNASGLIESVASGVPRLDYTNSSCPKILLEPQRSNLSFQSNDFHNWPTKVSVTTTDNYAVSPDGTTNADRLQFTGNGFMYGSNGYIQTTGVVYTLSCYAKRNGTGTQSIGFFIDGSGGVNSPWALTSNWQRFTYTFTAGNNSVVGIAASSGADVSVFGWQFEVGAYATSYIPTTSAAVTRLADAASKTGISSLIGQTAGTIYAEWTANNVSQSGRILAFGDGTFNNRIVILEDGGTIRLYIATSGAVQADLTSLGSYTGTHKIAVAYANNDLKVYVDGVAVATQTSLSVPPCSVVYVGTFEDGTGTVPLGGGFKQALVFKTRLTNAQLAELTTL
jgi:hypothetical protein